MSVPIFPISFAGSPDLKRHIKIRLKGCGHTDYFYDAKSPSSRDALRMKAQKFIAKVTANANDIDALNELLRDDGITHNAVNDIYTVNLERVNL